MGMPILTVAVGWKIHECGTPLDRGGQEADRRTTAGTKRKQGLPSENI